MTDVATPNLGRQRSPLSGALARERSARSPAPLRVGVIGYGYWGPNIVRNLSGLDGCELLAVCDRKPASLERARRSCPGVQLMTDAAELLRSPRSTWWRSSHPS